MSIQKRNYSDAEMWIAGQAIYGYHIGVAITDEEYESRQEVFDALRNEIELTKKVLKLVPSFERYDIMIGCELTVDLIHIIEANIDRFSEMSPKDIASEPNVVESIARHSLEMDKMDRSKIVTLTPLLESDGFQM